ncbi:MAG: hypothetical protein ACO3A2_03835 [Bdellovibrionia bacterium]
MMTPEMAAKAALAVRAKFSVPHHFKPFPLFGQTAKAFLDALTGSRGSGTVLVSEPSLIFKRKKTEGKGGVDQ